ncbi:MAG TPA: carbohydrate porin [Terriglobales bacterium]|nr:carbohydrate porin [Terriglobales bacterium]
MRVYVVVIFVALSWPMVVAQTNQNVPPGASDWNIAPSTCAALGDLSPLQNDDDEHKPAAQETDTTAPTDPPSMFPHSDRSRFYVSGQMNFVYQTNPPFHAAYTGANSLLPRYEKAISRVMTLNTGVELNQSTEVLVDVEETGGTGISSALGLAGFTNLDVVRNPELSKAPYLARAVFHKIIALGSETVESERNPLSLFTTLPKRRIELRIGKFSMVDFFDMNSAAGDSHFQFLNWTIDNSGAYDYPAETRGYTWGVVADYEAGSWGFRFAEGLLPKVANGVDLSWNLRRAHSENFEFQLRRGLIPAKAGTIRVLAYTNEANMGRYREAVDRFLAGIDPVPDITAHSQQVTRKYGFGMNLEQEVAAGLTAFARFGWNNGKTESYAYTEVDLTVLGGFRLDGERWRRKYDRMGLAFVSNGIARDHQRYLALGGLGFLLGDGGLNYGRESIVESFYTAHLWRGVYAGIDLQHINNPGYNRDRGPVIVPGLRLHLEF